MSILSENQLAGASGQGGGYTLTDSLRFRSSASAYLSRTPASASNRKTWTFSAWVKLGTIVNTYRCIFSANNSADYGTNGTYFWFRNDYKLQISIGSGTYSIVTNALFRDPSAWYHVVVAFDTTQGTSSNRVKMYVNGVEQTYSSSSYPTLNYQARVNDTSPHTVGSRRYTSVDSYFDGYITEINFVDGQALTASDFGETDTVTGVWQPKKYTGTYGTNGFYLDMSTSGSTVTDQSGNSNNWTATNMNLTTSSATTYDKMSDVPTLTDEDTGNFATLNPLSSRGVVPTDANLTDPAFGVNQSTTGTIGVSSGKWYFEVKGNSPYWVAGVTTLSTVPYGLSPNAVGSQGLAVYSANGSKYNNGSASAYGSTYTTNDIMAIALDLDAGTITFYKNGVSQGVAFTGLSGTYFPVLGGPDGYAHGSINFGQRPFAYTPPTGFKKLNTYNLPDSSIEDGSEYFTTVLYTGNGVNRSITGLEFSPDLVIGQSRSNAFGNWWFDTVRGATKQISSFVTYAESTQSTMVTAFNSDGFDLGTDTAGNGNGYTYVAWNWRGSDSTAVSNTAGTITSQVSANPTAGFSIATYTGNLANSTIGHGLGTSPSVVICKATSQTSDWQMYHAGIGATQLIKLNTNAAAITNGIWQNTAPTSSFFYIGASPSINASGADNVAYCFAEVEGYSKFGSYTGNASADGVFVYTGFKPAFLIVKSSTSAFYDWSLFDNKRDPYNQAGLTLFPDTAAAEYSSVPVDFLSNGFKWRTHDGAVNNAAYSPYIYMAFAENPFKNSLAR